MIITIDLLDAKFSMGHLSVTRGVDALLSDLGSYDSLGECISRHLRGDWGDLDEDDKHSNDLDLAGQGDDAGRLMSVYQWEGQKIWIITEWDRSVTTVLLPEEY